MGVLSRTNRQKCTPHCSEQQAASTTADLPGWLCSTSAGLAASKAICRASLLSTTAALARLIQTAMSSAAVAIAAAATAQPAVFRSRGNPWGCFSSAGSVVYARAAAAAARDSNGSAGWGRSCWAHRSAQRAGRLVLLQMLMCARPAAFSSSCG